NDHKKPIPAHSSFISAHKTANPDHISFEFRVILSQTSLISSFSNTKKPPFATRNDFFCKFPWDPCFSPSLSL
ncbi:hypothetical protein, partial [Siminovitchia fortis]|uniref:hypothetical protein n=1 Tax=Siminovitchia fortis TaxID=254758 RepID=UPI001ABF592F